MLNFFEGLIEKLGFKLISDFTEKLIDFIKDVKKNAMMHLKKIFAKVKKN